MYSKNMNASRLRQPPQEYTMKALRHALCEVKLMSPAPFHRLRLQAEVKDKQYVWSRDGPRAHPRKVWSERELELGRGHVDQCVADQPPLRQRFRRQPGDINVCNADCVHQCQFPCRPCPSLWVRLLCHLAKLPPVLLWLAMFYIIAKMGVWNGMDVTDNYTWSLREFFRNLMERDSASPLLPISIKRTLVQIWNTLVIITFYPITWLTSGVVIEDRGDEEYERIIIRKEEVEKKKEIDSICDEKKDESVKEVAEDEPSDKYRQEEETVEEDFDYSAMKPGMIERPFEGMPEFDLEKGLCKMYRDEDLQCARKWMVPADPERPCPEARPRRPRTKGEAARTCAHSGPCSYSTIRRRKICDSCTCPIRRKCEEQVRSEDRDKGNQNDNNSEGKENGSSKKEAGKENYNNKKETGKESGNNKKEPGKESDNNKKETGKESENNKKETGKESENNKKEKGKESDNNKKEKGKENNNNEKEKVDRQIMASMNT